MVKKKSIVSVVIPAYNEEEDIEGCVRTLINQSYKPLEIIFVDDGSTDKTLEILSKYKDIKVLKQDHKGPGAARNFGVSKSIIDLFRPNLGILPKKFSISSCCRKFFNFQTPFAQNFESVFVDMRKRTRPSP